MARYIDADKFISILNAKADMALGTPKIVFHSVVKMIEKLPTADVVEVKHGYWIDLNITEWQCSECNYRVERWNNTPYCPNCGAKMGGGNKE